MSSNPKIRSWKPRNSKEESAILQVRKRIFWKLIAIVIVIGAYTSLKALETATQKYEDERARPIVLVGEEVTSKNATKDADQKVNNSDCPPRSNLPPTKHYEATPVRICEAQAFVRGQDENSVALRKKLDSLETQYFPDEQAIITHLDQDIRTEADLKKRALRLTEDAENRSRASKLPNISRDENFIHEALRNIGFGSQLPPDKVEDGLDDLIKDEWDKLPQNERHATDTQIQQWEKLLTAAPGTANVPALEEKQLIVWHQIIIGQADYEARLKRLKKETAKIEENAQKQINLVYDNLKPALSDLIKASPGAPRVPDQNELRGWFNPRSLLDARSSAHVIYETVQLTLSMVLVLGVIFLLVLVLRFLPFFAGSTDELRDQTKAFLQRSGRTVPPIAKSLIVTASALAVGTAVVAAGNKAINPRTHDGAIYDAAYDDGNNPSHLPGQKGPGSKNPPLKPHGECPDCEDFPPDRVDLHVVKLEEPIAYPSPISVTGPTSLTLDSKSIDNLKLTIQDLLKTATGPVRDAELERQIRIITDRVVTEKLTTVTATCCKAGGDQTASPDSFLKLLGPTFTTIESIRRDLDATKKTLEEMQNSKVPPQTDSGGRGLVTRSKQFFKGDKYLVTQQTVQDLKTLMTKLPGNCPAGVGSPTQKCCGNEPITTDYCPDSKVDTILSRLTNMIGNSPLTESDFMKQLRVSNKKGDELDKTIDKWKSVILRYARVPY